MATSDAPRLRWIARSQASRRLGLDAEQLDRLARERGWEVRVRPRPDGLEEPHYPADVLEALATAPQLPVPAGSGGMEQLMLENRRVGEMQAEALGRLQQTLARMADPDALAEAVGRVVGPRRRTGTWLLIGLLVLTLVGGAGLVLVGFERLERRSAERAAAERDALARIGGRGPATTPAPTQPGPLPATVVRDDAELARLREANRQLDLRIQAAEQARGVVDKQVAERAAQIQRLRKELETAIAARARAQAASQLAVERAEAETARAVAERDGLTRQVATLTARVAELGKQLARTLTAEEIKRLREEED